MNRRLEFMFAWAGAALLPAAANAEIFYRVSPSAAHDKVAVEMEFSVGKGGVDLQMPSWSPGLYAIEDYWRSMGQVMAVDRQGKSLLVTHPRGDTWHVATKRAGRVRVHYVRPVSRTRERLGMFSSDDKTVHFSGPATYLYLVGRKAEKCKVEFDMPNGWKVAVGLNPSKGTGPHPIFDATNYDVLADNSVTMGDFLEDRYVVRGKEHFITYRGDDRDLIDRPKVLKMCRFVSEMETDFFGGAPYDRYVWHFWVAKRADGGGGVEHLSSTQMFMSTGSGPRAFRGAAHEFFHLWNVKRIRSKPLGPFDYTQMPRTGALWWLEGVTDYYALMLPHRYGWANDSAFLDDAMSNIGDVRENPARFEVSPYDSSYRVGEATEGRSSGYKVNYYPTGWVLGMMFDIELRARSHGKRSLDDIEHALWSEFRHERPGFEEDELRKQLIHFGGLSMGELYDRWVMRPGELPVEVELAKVGLQIVERDGRKVIVASPKASSDELALREGWFFGTKKRPTVFIESKD